MLNIPVMPTDDCLIETEETKLILPTIEIALLSASVTTGVIDTDPATATGSVLLIAATACMAGRLPMTLIGSDPATVAASDNPRVPVTVLVTLLDTAMADFTNMVATTVAKLTIPTVSAPVDAVTDALGRKIGRTTVIAIGCAAVVATAWETVSPTVMLGAFASVVADAFDSAKLSALVSVRVWAVAADAVAGSANVSADVIVIDPADVVIDALESAIVEVEAVVIEIGWVDAVAIACGRTICVVSTSGPTVVEAIALDN
jgi:hypothetical protein